MEDTNQTENKTSKMGCLKSLLKLATWVVIPILTLTFLMNWIKEVSAVDEIGRSLIPFHNGYLSIDDYYLTVEWLSSSWPIRLLIFFVPSLMLLAIINAISSSLISSEKAKIIFIRILMITLLGIVVGLVWFVPETQSTIDVEGKQIIRTKFEITKFSTSILPFDQIEEIWYEFRTKSESRDRYKKYLYIKAMRHDGTVWLIGVQSIGSFSPPHEGYTKNEFQLPISAQESAYGESIIRQMRKLIYP
jgi:hypothetical protein